MRAQAFIAVVTGVVSLLMAWLVARFINRPVQALRAAMARVAAGDLSVRAPVRSADELGELNAHFNAMVDDLRMAERTRELFGRYVSPAVARDALERGVALGGETIRATAMFVDLRGFTAMSRRSTPERVVEVLTEYYAIVERVCEREGGVITQFLGDGVVVVFGGPLQPLPDHARAAVRAAIALQRALAERNAVKAHGSDASALEAGIGICTGDMIAGNVGTGGRVTYTIVGDAVNQAARLQVMTRDLAAAILRPRARAPRSAATTASPFGRSARCRSKASPSPSRCTRSGRSLIQDSGCGARDTGRASFCDGHHRGTRTVEGSSAGPTEPERAYGAAAGERRIMARSARRGRAWHS